MATAYRWSENLVDEGHRPTPRPIGPHGRPRAVPKPGRTHGPMAVPGKRPSVVEFYTVKKIDNSRLVRHVEPVKLRNLYKTAALGGIIAIFFMLYIYQHFRCIDLSFQLEDLRAKQGQAQALNSELKLERETLRDPHRIDVIAQKELGLKRPAATQVREYANPDGSEVAAVRYVRTDRAP